MGATVAILAAISAGLVARRRQRRRLPARAVIVSPRTSTVAARDGAVRSLQSAELTVSADDLDRLWQPKNLENLARTYWRFLSRATLGLIRVVYGQNERSVVLLRSPLTLLRFEGPDYVLESEHGKVLWQIRDGLLVARAGRGHGFLAVDVRKVPGVSDGRARLLIEVEVANFYPAIAAGFSMPVYKATQSVIHVLVTHSFLRSLATLDLAESRVRRLAMPADPAPAEDPVRTDPRTESGPAGSPGESSGLPAQP